MLLLTVSQIVLETELNCGFFPLFSMRRKAHRRRTPVFAGIIRYVIFRPYWDVPNSITCGELLPEIERDPQYLSEHDYEIVERDGRVLDTSLISENVRQRLLAGQLRIRQKPGINKALGLLKFVFPHGQTGSADSIPLHPDEAEGLHAVNPQD